MTYTFEKKYPIISTISILVAFIWWAPDIHIREGILQAVISVFSVIFGFLLTALTLLRAYEKHIFIRLLRELGRYENFLGYLKTAIKISFLITVIALGLLFVPETWVSKYSYVSYGFIALIIYGVLTSYRFLHIFLRMITREKKASM